MGQPVVSWIEHHAARTPDRPALVDLHRGREVTYGELAARVRALAWSLADRHGVRAGDRVAVLTRNDTRAFEVVYACALLGAIAVPLNWRLTVSELTAVGLDAEPAVLVHESWAEPVAAEVAAGADIGARIAWASSGTIVFLDVVLPPVEFGTYSAEHTVSLKPGAFERREATAGQYLKSVAETHATDLLGIPTEMDVVAGAAAHEIYATARLEHADLIVMCSQGETGLKRWLFGSVAHDAIQHTPVPVLVLNEHGGLLPGTKIEDQESSESHAGSAFTPLSDGTGEAACADWGGTQKHGGHWRPERKNPHLQLPAKSRNGSPHWIDSPSTRSRHGRAAAADHRCSHHVLSIGAAARAGRSGVTAALASLSTSLADTSRGTSTRH